MTEKPNIEKLAAEVVERAKELEFTKAEHDQARSAECALSNRVNVRVKELEAAKKALLEALPT